MNKIFPFLVILSGCMWGAGGVFVRLLTAIGLDNVSIIETRMLFASIILVLALLIFRRDLLKFKWKDAWIFLCAGICSSLLLNVFMNIAINLLSLSFATVLLSTMPVYVIFLAAIFFKEKITGLKIFCAILVVIGCFFVSDVLFSGTNLSTIGILSGIMSGLGYALYSIFTRVGLNRNYHPLTITTYCTLISAILFAFVADWGLILSTVSADPGRRLLLLLLQSLICVVGPYSLYNISLKHMDTGIASILASCEPVAATILGFVLFDESPTAFALIGLVIVLFALALLSKPISIKSKKPVQENP